MGLETFEAWARRAGALGAVVAAGVALFGAWRGMLRAKGRESGKMPDFLQQPALLLPLSGLGVGLLYLLWKPLPVALPRPARAAATVLGTLLYFPGLALFFWGRWAMGRMYNVSSATGARLYADHQLVTTGPFAVVRHPMYVAGALWEIGALLLYRKWATLVITLNIFSLVRRSRREEEALAAEFGEEWQTYASRVPGWLPRPGLRRLV